MSSPASPTHNTTKDSKQHRHAHDRKKTRSKPKRAAKPTPDPVRFDFIDDWNAQDVSGWLAPSKPPENPVAFKAWEQQGKVDRLRDLIPFWRDGVSAAEKGREVAKMEDFLQRLDEEERSGIWQTKNNGWGKDLGEDVWGPTNRRPDARGSRPSDNGAAWDPAGPGGWNTGRRWGSDSGHGWEPPAAEQGWSGVLDNAGWGVAAGGAVPRSEGISPRSEDTSASAAAAWHEGEPGDSWTFVEEIARQEAASHERRRDMHEFYAMSTQEKLKKIGEVVDYLRDHSA